ncbi:MAG TPA: TIGR00303 family protein [Methanoregulaceae archaeon]|nr:TIGR00303 family protein [Methanoregulaceae archaeon]
MPFLSETPSIRCSRPLFAAILANTLLSTVPGISGAGPSPEKTLLTPNLDAELVTSGTIWSRPARPDTPTGCPTPASITRAATQLAGLVPLLIDAGLAEPPAVPCIDLHASPGGDPRLGTAVPDAARLIERGRMIGRFLSGISDLLVLGECVPGGTTTALCVLRALGYPARVSSSFVVNPTGRKEEVVRTVLERMGTPGLLDPVAVLRETGDPMMPVAVGIAQSYQGTLLLAGGTQYLAVAAVLRALGDAPPSLVTTTYVRDDPTANFAEIAGLIGVRPLYVDPGFGDLGHAGLARYCIGEVKEGMGAGGALALALLLGHSPDEIRAHVLATVRSYS